MWEIAPGFQPIFTGLTEVTKTALDRMAEKVHARGGRLLVTSAYRPGGRGLHGRGEAVDVWVPGWTHDRIASLGLEAGFISGYIPTDKNFVELGTAPKWYAVQGAVFGRAGAPEGPGLQGMWEAARGAVFGRAGRPADPPDQPGAGIWGINFHRAAVIAAFVLLFIVLIGIFVKEI